MPYNLPQLADCDFASKTVLLRIDSNTPHDTLRLQCHAQTIRTLLAAGAKKVVVLSHLGRPSGRVVPELSLRPQAAVLENYVGQPVHFVPDCVGRMAEQAVQTAPHGSVLLLENVRFQAAEEQPQTGQLFAKSLAKLGDVYVNDAFASAHRNHTSLTLLPQLLPSAAGPLLAQEVARLEGILTTPTRPLLLMLGGTNLAHKMPILQNALGYANQIMVGGALANTLLAAKDMLMGKSHIEMDYIEPLRDFLVEAGIVGCRILMPADVMTTNLNHPMARPVAKAVHQLEPDDTALDIGPETVKVWSRVIQNAGTMVWSGPMGSYELAPFDEGTNNLANAMLHSPCPTKVVAGGDTLDALKRTGLREQFSQLSTGGAAFLAMLAGEPLPALTALQYPTERRLAA
ncbi:MAG: phosphoglycerate kinase [Alphaproteobacteria bacterium]